jgi:WhiB family redox-sensing transcriptional regulator
MNWDINAACRDFDPELFFPANENDLESAQVAAAKAVCDGCPAEAACLSNALTPFYDQYGEQFHDVHGVRGGLTGAEREQQIRRSRAA